MTTPGRSWAHWQNSLNNQNRKKPMKRRNKPIIAATAGLLAVLMNRYAVCAEEEIPETEEPAAEERTEEVSGTSTEAAAFEGAPEEAGNEEETEREEENPVRPAEPTVNEPAPAETQKSEASEQTPADAEEAETVSREITTEGPAEEEEPEVLSDAEEAEEQEEIPAEDTEPEEPPVMIAMRSAPADVESDSDQNEAEAADDAVQSTAAVTIGKTAFSTDEDVSSGWDSSTGTGWRNVADEYVAMVGFDGSKTDLTYKGEDLTIMAAGTNRIRKIVGEGNLNLTGTGLLLIDEIQLSEGSTFNLHTNTAIYESGSVAVFLKDKGSKNVYTMINGGVSGLIDELTELPAGVTLVVPSGNTLELEVVAAGIKETETEDGQTIRETVYSADGVSVEDYYHAFIGFPEVSTGRLVIPSGSTLRIEENAKVLMSEEPVGWTDWQTAIYVYGTLENNGEVIQGVVEAKSGSVLTGSGQFEEADVAVDGIQSIKKNIAFIDSNVSVYGGSITDTINMTGGQLKLYGKGLQIGTLNISGSIVNYLRDTYVGNITIKDGGKAEFGVLDDGIVSIPDQLTRILTIGGKLSGGTLQIESGRVVLEEGFTMENSTISRAYDFILDNRSAVNLPLQHTAPVVTSAEYAQPYTEEDTVPVVFVQRSGTITLAGSILASAASTPEAKEYLPRENGGALIEYTYQQLIYKDAEQEALKDYVDTTEFPFVSVEVYKVAEDGTVQVTVLRKNDQAVTLDGAFLIRTVAELFTGSSTGGSSSVEADSSFTGSGTLGGNSDGVITASTSGSSIFTGTGIAKEKDKTDSGGTTADASRPAAIQADETTAVTATTVQRPVTVPAALTAYVTPANRRTAGRKAKPDGYKTIPADRYTLTVYSGNTLLSSLGGRSVAAEFFYAAKTDRVHVFFRDAYGILHETPSVYDKETGTLKMTSTRTGSFLVVQEKMPGKAAHPAVKYTIH